MEPTPEKAKRITDAGGGGLGLPGTGVTALPEDPDAGGGPSAWKPVSRDGVTSWTSRCVPGIRIRLIPLRAEADGPVTSVRVRLLSPDGRTCLSEAAFPPTEGMAPDLGIIEAAKRFSLLHAARYFQEQAGRCLELYRERAGKEAVSADGTHGPATDPAARADDGLVRSVRGFLAFEQETSPRCPFAVEEPTDEQIRRIAAICGSDETDDIYDACEQVLGRAPGL